VLWVADPSPRAQAFYRKHGFAADGTAGPRTGCGIRMVRGAQRGVSCPHAPDVNVLTLPR
jgi:hypothetical protein